ncbi:glycosyltransferase family 4 protein [Hypoxylon trugodes]|uniref:glycosyltransferase family 4 protein n=1 Tax=Hypoxylon trugodes TaxID=326681 RepID=UPI002197426B|nr:glycosyltransferase family 4 protein [Hypoxylon trugodes]KAI1382871.1 glycosyltransferase family 4 protein [Hypoxylon trugodes]
MIELSGREKDHATFILHIQEWHREQALDDKTGFKIPCISTKQLLDCQHSTSFGVQSSMAPILEKRRRFSTTSAHHQRRLSEFAAKHGLFSRALTPLFLGISAVTSEDGTVVLSIATHDNTYLIDYMVEHLKINDQSQEGKDAIADYVVSQVQKYEHQNFVKFVGAGLPLELKKLSPTLNSRLWLEVDIVPIDFDTDQSEMSFWDEKNVDEQADSMARKCVMIFGPSLVPILQVGFRGAVMSDAGFKAHLTTLEDYKSTCGKATWDSTIRYANELKGKKVKIAFFSSTPQGGGVALMRHALVRFSRLAGVDLTWYVPKPRPGVFRSTKNMHNILQGVSKPDERISPEEQEMITDWITENANRYWLSKGGPLRPVEEGGADVIVIDDPQMPGLIPLIKEVTPNRPVIYRSHIQIRSDLVAQGGSPQEQAWNFLWSNIRHADMFVSHPIPKFVPDNVPRELVTYMPATTDWLDGLNKPINEWDTGYYGSNYNSQCHAQHMTTLRYPECKYIVQVARFDPAKGIPTVIDSYGEFRKRAAELGLEDIPQLVVAGNSSIDDPDGNIIYDIVMEQIEIHYPDLAGDISVMRLQANDQLLNTLIAKAHVVLQLSTREGFEVKVSEALHAGRPVIATLAGGIPIQVKDRENGFLVEPDDYKAVAEHLVELFTDQDLWNRMSDAARTGVSDEVGTVGNALCWYYLANKFSHVGGVKQAGAGPFKGNCRWVNDLAREEAGHPYAEGENRLPRQFTRQVELPRFHENGSNS